MPVTALTPRRGTCAAAVAHAPHRCGPTRCPRAPSTPRCWPRSARRRRDGFGM